MGLNWYSNVHVTALAFQQLLFEFAEARFNIVTCVWWVPIALEVQLFDVLLWLFGSIRWSNLPKIYPPHVAFDSFDGLVVSVCWTWRLNAIP